MTASQETLEAAQALVRADDGEDHYRCFAWAEFVTIARALLASEEENLRLEEKLAALTCAYPEDDPNVVGGIRYRCTPRFTYPGVDYQRPLPR